MQIGPKGTFKFTPKRTEGGGNAGGLAEGALGPPPGKPDSPAAGLENLIKSDGPDALPEDPTEPARSRYEELDEALDLVEECKKNARAIIDREIQRLQTLRRGI